MDVSNKKYQAMLDLIQQVNERIRHDRNAWKDFNLVLAKLASKDLIVEKIEKPKPGGPATKPGELFEMIDLLRSYTPDNPVPGYLVADEGADLAYYFVELDHRFPDSRFRDAFIALSNALGLTADNLLDFAIAKYGWRCANTKDKSREQAEVKAVWDSLPGCANWSAANLDLDTIERIARELEENR